MSSAGHASVVADRDGGLPGEGVTGEGSGASSRASIQIVAGCLVVAQAEAPVGLVGEPEHALVLEDKVAQAVEDGLALVYLDAAQKVGPVPGEHGAALVDGPAGEVFQNAGGDTRVVPWNSPVVPLSWQWVA